MKLDVGSIFKYHNHIIKVVKKTADTIIGEPYFFDNQIGNLQFTAWRWFKIGGNVGHLIVVKI